MMRKIGYSFLVIVFAVCNLRAQEPKSPEVLIKESLVNIESNDLHVAA